MRVDNCQILNAVLSNLIPVVFVDLSRNKSQPLITHTDSRNGTNEFFLWAAVNADWSVNMRANYCRCGRLIMIFTSQCLQTNVMNINFEFKAHIGYQADCSYLLVQSHLTGAVQDLTCVYFNIFMWYELIHKSIQTEQSKQLISLRNYWFLSSLPEQKVWQSRFSCRSCCCSATNPATRDALWWEMLHQYMSKCVIVFASLW